MIVETGDAEYWRDRFLYMQELYKRSAEANEKLRQALEQPEQEPVVQEHESRITSLEIRVAKLEKPMTEHEKQLMAGQRSLLRTTEPPKQTEQYDQTELELCEVCGWKTLIPDDGCLNCERGKVEQEPVAWMSNSPTKGNGKQLHWTKAEAWRWSSNIAPLYAAPPKQTEQEPVAMRYGWDGHGYQYIDFGSGSDWRERHKDGEPLYAAPPKREWVGLTQREIIDLRNMINWMTDWSYGTFAYAIEQKLKEKNA